MWKWICSQTREWWYIQTYYLRGSNLNTKRTQKQYFWKITYNDKQKLPLDLFWHTFIKFVLKLIRLLYYFIILFEKKCYVILMYLKWVSKFSNKHFQISLTFVRIVQQFRYFRVHYTAVKFYSEKEVMFYHILH